jgi:hypothetical protein
MTKGRTMAKTWKILFLTLLVLSLTFVATAQVRAQQQYPYINSEILPAQGGANTTIILRFTTTPGYNVSNVASADIFWDNNTLYPLNQAGTIGADGSYNYNITVPNESPLSDVGNHTIRVDSTVVPYGAISFFFIFNITEFIPSPEYQELNDTYYSLLTNYTQLQSSYTVLSANYTTLLAENTILNYNTLLSQYNALISNYNALTANYNQVLNTYGNLTATYNSMSSTYANLQANFQTLSANYSTLSQDYNRLNSSYTGLLSNYNALVGQLDFSRNLNYTLIIITIALALITVYYAYFKPKKPTKTR